MRNEELESLLNDWLEKGKRVVESIDILKLDEFEVHDVFAYIMTVANVFCEYHNEFESEYELIDTLYEANKQFNDENQ